MLHYVVHDRHVPSVELNLFPSFAMTTIPTSWLQVIVLLVALTAFAPLARSKSRTKGRLWPAAMGNATVVAQEEMAEKALFGMGCFWGPQHAFHSLPGVLSATTGYANFKNSSDGRLIEDRPTSYLSVCAGDGRTEAVLIEFLPSIISYERLLRVFWQQHDSTTKQKPQYQSVVWPLNENHRRIAERTIAKAKESNSLTLTIIAGSDGAAGTRPMFSVAESVHQHFWTKFRLKATCLGAGALFGATSIQDEFVTDAMIKMVLLWILWEGIELVFKGVRSLGWHYPFRREPRIAP